MTRPTPDQRSATRERAYQMMQANRITRLEQRVADLERKLTATPPRRRPLPPMPAGIINDEPAVERLNRMIPDMARRAYDHAIEQHPAPPIRLALGA